jgi:leucyl-tRNA synthetase
LDFDEPFKNLLTQGMVLKDGSKMSKSKGNTVDPDEIFKHYGADTARLFILSDSPPERDLDWSDSGVEGCYKFLNRVWRLYFNIQDKISLDFEIPTELSKESDALLREVHMTVKKISNDISNEFQFNTVISKTREFVNSLYDYTNAKTDYSEADKAVLSYAAVTLIKLLAPIVPHMAEDLYASMGADESIHTQDWPIFDETLAVSQSVTVVVQINGQVREKLEVSPEISKDELEKLALDNEKVKSFIDGSEIVKLIVVPGRLVNIVIK